MSEYSVIGKSVPRVDGLEKVNGQGKYAADFNMPGQLWCKILRAPHAHARILNIDTSKAERMVGVEGVLTSKDFNGWTWGWAPQTRDEPPLAMDKVRMYAEGVAAVCAVDEATAEEACSLIEVEYEPLPGVFDPEEAMKADAPKVHENVRTDSSSNACEIFGCCGEDHSCVQNNLSWDFHMNYGDVEKGFREADLVREDRFETGRVNTGFLEPPASVAVWDSTGITVYAAKQSPYFHYRHLASCFGLPLSKVRVVQPLIGAGFGGTKNDSVAGDFCAVLFSKRTGKPVKFVYNMQEVIMTCRRRHNMVVYNKMGMKKDGTITAMHSRLIADGGAYTAIGPLSMYLSGCMSTLPYKLPNFRHDAYRIYTNNPVGAAMRGHGVTHTRFAAEIQMEMMAEELGIDFLEVRMKNAITAPHTTINGVTVTSCGLKEGLQVLANSPAWKEREKNKEKSDTIAHGVGISGTSYLGGARQRGHQSCAAIVRLCEDGTVDYLTGATDCGQGSDTGLVQIVAEVLGLGMEDVAIKRVDTAMTPCDAGSYGSRVTDLAGQAAMKAAQDVRQQLAEFAAKMWQVSSDDIEFKNHRVFAKSSPDKSLDFRKLTQAACYSETGMVVIGKGYSQVGIEPLDFDRGYGNCGTSYSFTSQLTEVDVDLETGFTKATNFLIAHDCGYPLNPMTVEAQCQGGAIQGLGQAIYEEFKMEEGFTRNANLCDYKMPLSLDVPDIETVHIITEDPQRPYGAKEASEGSHVSTPPSVISAIHHATGIWFKSQPVTPEKIVLALKAKRESEVKS